MKRKASQAVRSIVKRARNHLMNNAGGYAKMASGYIGSKLQGGPQKTDTAMSTLTTQNDTARAYIKKKKKTSKKSRKRILRKKKFVANVKKAVATGEPLLHYNEFSSLGQTVVNPATAWSTSPYQVWYAGGFSSGAAFSSAKFTLWGCQIGISGATETNDVNRYMTQTAAKLQNRFNSTDVAPPQTTTQSIYIKYCKWECAVQNLSLFPYTVDLYEFVAARNIPQTDTKSSPYDCMTENKAETTLTTGYTGVIDQEQYGTTPFDFANFGRTWTIKNKTTVLLGAGQSTTFEVVGPRGLWRSELTNDLIAQKGKTTMFAFCFHSKIGFGQTASSTFANIVFNKTYKFKYPVGAETLVNGIEQTVAQSYA